MQSSRAIVKAQALLRGYLARRAYSELVKKKRRRDLLVLNIVENERSYVKNLHIVIKEYLIPLKSEPNKYNVTKEEISNVFSNLETIASTHGSMLARLEPLIANWTNTSAIGITFWHFAPFLKQLTVFARSNFSEIIIRLSAERKQFNKFLKQVESKPKILPLLSYLEEPLQRVPIYEQWLKELIDNTWEWHKDFNALLDASREMSNVSEQIRKSEKIAQNQSRLLQIQNDLGAVEVIAPNRLLILEGILTRSKPNKQLWVYLCNDIIIFAGKSLVGKLKFIESFALAHVQLSQKSPELFSLSLGYSSSEYTLSARSTVESLKWFSAIQTAIAELKKPVAPPLKDSAKSHAESSSESSSDDDENDKKKSRQPEDSDLDPDTKYQHRLRSSDTKYPFKLPRIDLQQVRLQKAQDFIKEEQRKSSLLETSIKKGIASDLLNMAFKVLEEEKPSLAKCYLTVSTNIYESAEDLERRNQLIAEIDKRERLTEHELQAKIEAKAEAVKTQIIHAEHQVANVRSIEEAQMIEHQLDVLRNQERELNAQLGAIEVRNKELQEREQRALQREQLISEQTQHLEQLLAELIATSSVIDSSVLQQQMSNVVAGDKDVDAARRRFAGLQKAARDAQQMLVVEERRQRERVEWLQKQMELYKVKGMSPAHLAYRNFLKDVKRLSSVRHHLEHTPYPLRCFISYAWETTPEANKELQQRLQKLKDDLEMAGMEVMLDVRDMNDNMKTFMIQGIENADKVLLICTPRLKVRAADQIKNNLQLELETAIAKSKTTPKFIVPLIFSGSYRDALPPQVEDLLSLNFAGKGAAEEDQMHYYESIASLAPMGLIPMLLDLARNKEYKNTAARFFGDLKDYGLVIS